MSVPATQSRGAALAVAAAVTDPELPVLTLADLGVLRGVEVAADGAATVTITPTWSGCPALATMRDDLVHRLSEAGFGPVEVRVELDPPWTSDDITARGRERLAAYGVSPPGPAPHRTGPVPLRLGGTRRVVHCPRCGGSATLLAEHGPTPCTALYRCDDCAEPFQHVKEVR